MKIKNILMLSLLVWAFTLPAEAAKKFRVVATVPELADIARRIGGDLVEVDGIARGTEDIHQVVMRPSFVPKINRADVVVYLGLTIEHAFLPGLLEAAVNPKMRSDVVKECLGPGCVDCSEGLNVLEKPDTLSRAEGEIHPQGNPHYNAGPDQGPLIARNVSAGLSRVDPDHAAEYQKNLKAYLGELEPKLAEWRRWVKSLKGVKAVSFHKDVAYLGRFTGIDFVDTLEMKPGVAPTPTHLERLVKEMKEQNIKLIIREQQYDPKLCQWLAEQTGAHVAVIGSLAHAFPDTDTFIKFSEHNLKAILAAAGKEPS